MPTLTLKNIPEELYTELKQAAKIHRRSLNSEILYCVERVLSPRKINVAETLARAEALRALTAEHPITNEELNDAKN